MRAMIMKEFRQMRRDRRTLAMMIVMPVLLLVVFGYAANFDVSTFSTVASGPSEAKVSPPSQFPVVARDKSSESAGMTWAQDELRDGHAVIAVVAGTGGSTVLVDGSQLFAARAALATLAGSGQSGGEAATPGGHRPVVRILYNPGLRTADVMIPGLTGLVLIFVGIFITSLGVVRERQTGMLEQLAVMPLRPRDVFVGKIVPYLMVAILDLGVVLAIGLTVFGVPFRGSPAVFALGALLFLLVTLGIGVLISTVSENQGQAIQLAMMATLPQVLLSGLIFPLSSVTAGVRWLSYLLPLTYFNEIARGVMLRAEPIGPLWKPFLLLAILGIATMTVGTLRLRRLLSSSGTRERHTGTPPAPPAMPPAVTAQGQAASR
jgi:ABC-2 type transport system permease protein